MRDGFYPEPGKYLTAVRKARTITRAGGLVRMAWNCGGLDAQAFRDEFRGALHRRINLKAAMIGERAPETGRKHDALYQSGLARDCRRVHQYVRYAIVDPVNRLETPELQHRYGWRHGPDGLDVDLPSGLLRAARPDCLANA